MLVAFRSYIANRGLVLLDKKNLRVPIQILYLTQSFFSRDLFWFWSLGYPGVRSGGWVGGVILVLRIFPELLGRPVQNLVEIGLVVRT